MTHPSTPAGRKTTTSHSVEPSLQGTLSKGPDWYDTDAMIKLPAKTQSVVIATRQRRQPSPLHLQLTLEKDTH